MKNLLVIIAFAFAAGSAFAQQQTTAVQMQCRNMSATGNFLNPDETMVNGMACHPVAAPTQTVANAPMSNPSAIVAAPASAPEPVASPVTSAQPAPAAQAPVAAKPCLIVRQAEGHRFRNSMIAGALTGGIGFAAGAASGGAKYEYVDSFDMSATKLKYKGKELQDLQQQGTHIVTVSKKATGEEIKDARDSCRE